MNPFTIQYEAEIARLTEALHANVCHQDYEYMDTVISPSFGDVMLREGWKRNPEYQAAPNDECWRRRKEQA